MLNCFTYLSLNEHDFFIIHDGAICAQHMYILCDKCPEKSNIFYTRLETGKKVSLETRFPSSF